MSTATVSLCPSKEIMSQYAKSVQEGKKLSDMSADESWAHSHCKECESCKNKINKS